MTSAAAERLRRARQALEGLDPAPVSGRITELVGLTLRATLPGARVGDYVTIARAGQAGLGAEVIGFSGEQVLLMPLGEVQGLGASSRVINSGERLSLRCGSALLGCVLDALGEPWDSATPLARELHPWACDRPPPDPLSRPPITRPLTLGVRAIDGLLTVGEGQRLGLFAGSGVGKSTLLGQLARQAEVDVCVVCLIGERGREVREFIDGALGPGLARAVVVCATSDVPPLLRLKAAHTATAVAEWFRQDGRRVLLLMDSVTRYARALREVALAAGEPPARRGYPPSVFAQLPRLLERGGTAPTGSITAIYTVLVEGDDLEEPVADETRGILDGHIVLSRRLAEEGHWPAIDVLQSVSRVMPAVTDEAQRRAAQRLRQLLAVYEARRDLIVLGAYQRGSDAETDLAVAKIDAIRRFLRQGAHERCSLGETTEALGALLRD
ncbi:MAG: FliI/YscN family ATPase [Proteobacteria bacterium]|nr:FliI/YscN family ATPase [Pseudomonadota bacterium]